MRPYVEYVHVKDALAGSGTVVPAGEGTARYRRPSPPCMFPGSTASSP